MSLGKAADNLIIDGQAKVIERAALLSGTAQLGRIKNDSQVFGRSYTQRTAEYGFRLTVASQFIAAQ